jgi:isopentenyldiphosphate isomerase
MLTEEIFDVFNEQRVKIGTASRSSVHAEGLWHQTFHCWIVSRSASGGSSLLLQLRHKDKDVYPNMLDISCAGHLQSEEQVEDGIRELHEELGLVVDFEALHYCGCIAEENIISADLIDREFNHMFIYKCDDPLESYSFQRSEISGLFYIPIVEFLQLLDGTITTIDTEGVVVDEADERLIRVRRTIDREHIAPISKKYFELLFDNIAKLALL